ncbi:MAG: helix-turn-helix transcriptional regulator [Rubrobacteraceae bacterium]
MSFQDSLSDQDLPKKIIPIVDRLQAVSAEVSEELADAVMEAVPERYRDTTDRECRPLCRTLVPVALECIARGTKPNEEALYPIRLSARRTLSDGIPASVTLTGIRAAMGRFTSIVARHAELQDAVAVLAVMGRAAVLIQLFVTVFVSGSEADPRGRPGWWSEQLPVARDSLRLVARGLSTSEIAQELNYSEQTITYHLGNLMKWFDCSNRTEMVSRAYEAGVIGDSADSARGGMIYGTS